MSFVAILGWFISVLQMDLALSHPLFETYQGYKEGELGQRFKNKFDKHIPIEGRDKLRVLHIGAKTSDFAEKLYEDGFLHVDNIDLMEDKMKVMTERMEELSIPNTVTFQAGDMFEFGAANTYDIVIDKGAVELTVDGHSKYLPHCWDILKENGLFISIGPFPPHGSEPNGWWLSGDMAPSNWKTNDKNGWQLDVEIVDNSYINVPHPDKFYLYFLRKMDAKKNQKQEI
eukprot:362939_1